jgi:quercetin dioxygenase-like cupin family protein
MSAIDRPLSGDALHYRLGDGPLPDLIDEHLVERAGKSARTLVKDGPLRVTLVALGEGGALSEHSAGGPITVHVLSGGIRLTTGAKEWELGPGELLSLGAGVPHSVNSTGGGVFLLTVATAE